jgi:type IV secretory pathway VirB10-like protein
VIETNRDSSESLSSDYHNPTTPQKDARGTQDEEFKDQHITPRHVNNSTAAPLPNASVATTKPTGETDPLPPPVTPTVPVAAVPASPFLPKRLQSTPSPNKKHSLDIPSSSPIRTKPSPSTGAAGGGSLLLRKIHKESLFSRALKSFKKPLQRFSSSSSSVAVDADASQQQGQESEQDDKTEEVAVDKLTPGNYGTLPSLPLPPPPHTHTSD